MTVEQFSSYQDSPISSKIIRSGIAERILINFIGGIPRPFGTVLRRLTYSSIFAQMGRGVYIQAGVEFIGAYSIEIGENVQFMRDVRCDMKSLNSVNSLLRIGNRVCFDRNVDIKAAGPDCLIEIGDESFIGPYVCIVGPGHIKIGKECMIASHTGIYANNHREYGISREGIEIQDNCWIGCGVRLLDGVTIGRGSVIGAGSVVTKDIPPFSIAVGVPAKVIKSSKGSKGGAA
ncbi:MAG: DapH/DapD/GlmU-related protein [Scytonema sp. PMC 1069.18]|nr:DapH/DapD/GlmU-related protein [Scytonema sp. PMC 1069.18]MEC4882857.1 DapH/DapD/GlmU-related protein [Scytonema sp. PMC 1070.18]